MLRKLTTLLLLSIVVLAIGSLVEATPEIEPEIKLRIIGEEIQGESRDRSISVKYQRSNQVWQYKPRLGKKYRADIGNNPRESMTAKLMNALEGLNEKEGYSELEQFQQNPARYGPAPRNLIIENIPTPQSEYESYTQELEAKNSIDNTPSTNQQQTTTQNTNQCGANGEYYKLCYRDNAINAINAPSRELNTYINKEIRNARAKQGFLLIVYAPEDQDKPKRDEQRVRMSREASAKSDAQASIPSTHRLLTLSYTRQATGEHPAAAYLVPDTLTNEDNAAINPARSSRTNTQPAEALLRSPSKTINDVWQEEWTTQANTFRGSEQLTSLTENIYEEKGIRVYLATNQEEWQATDYDVLDEQLREQIRIGNSNANNPEKHPQPCTAYLLLDQQGISLYQSEYCPLSHARHEHKNEPSNQQANRLLTSALSQTRGLDAQELYLHAYRLAEKASTLYDGTSEAEALTNYMITNPYFETQSQRAMQASQEIILAKVALVEGNLQEAHTRAREHTQEAHPRIQSLGADVALQAATQLGECSEIQATLNEVDEHINRRGTTIREAQEALRECQLQEARSRCELVDNSRHTDTTAALEIVYVNDDLSENDFRDYTEAITRQLLGTSNLDAHQQHMLFRRTQTSEPLIQTQGPLSPPRVNTQAAKLATTACHGDIAVVLSEKNFLPSTVQGDGYVSETACGSAQCMGAYTLRSMAFSVFNLQQEEQTITGPHTFDPDDKRIQERLSEQQQTTIQDYFNTIT